MFGSFLLLLLTAAAQGLRINAGGNQYTDAQGRTWETDDAYILPDAVASAGVFWNFGAPISNTDSDPLYQTERYFNRWAAGTKGYELPVPSPGTYHIRLHFAEINFIEVGKRSFDVFIDGELELDNLDLVAQVGPFAPFVYEVVKEVNTTSIVIEVTVGADSPKFSALEVIDEALLPPPTVSPAPTPAPEPTATIGAAIRLNSGGPLIFDSAGNPWVADTRYLYSAQGGSYASGATIADVTDPSLVQLYQTERWFNIWEGSGLAYGYEIPVATPGFYRVRVHFAVSE